MFHCGGVQCPGLIALSFAGVFVCLCLFWCSFPVCSSGVLCCGVSSYSSVELDSITTSVSCVDVDSGPGGAIIKYAKASADNLTLEKNIPQFSLH